MDTITKMVKEESKDRQIIYITVNRSYKTMSNHFQKEGIDAGKILFVDCISKQAGISVQAPNCICTQGQKSLTELSIVLADALSTAKNPTVILDSATSLLVYNEIDTVERFLTYIINKTTTSGAKLLMFFIDGQSNEKLRILLSSLVDTTIRKQ